jgi:hypothetical protein
MGMLSPILKTPLELAAGKSMFTNRQFTRQESAAAGRILEHGPEWMRAYMGYKKEVDGVGRATYTFDAEKFYVVFQSYLLSRVMSTSDRAYRTLAKDPAWTPVLIDFFTGLRYKKLNLDEEKEKMLREREKLTQEAAIKSGEAREFRRVYTPRGQ